MADVTFRRIEEIESYKGPGGPSGQFLYAGKELGVTAWGMNVLRLPAGWSGYPEHDHAEEGQEEVYVVLEGSATLTADDETLRLEPGTLVRVGARQKRKIVPGGEGVVILALGGSPGRAYQPRWLSKKS
ncbi:MAG TPA: cupin domain-containing protein [Candidatus Polarisedimenticolia bacterium]|nr:cupin domain-containing protein [Candidatus Polarisedimenticolia bacterium]